MRVLLTGGHGFVGQHLHRELVGHGHEVHAPRSSELDVRDARLVDAVVARIEPEAIVHLAAISHPRDAAADPLVSYAVAIGGTAALVEAIRSRAPNAVLLAVSSAEVYGSRDDLPLREDSGVRPASIYGLGKVALESIAIAASARFGIRSVVVRPFNLSGRGQTTRFVVPALAERVAIAAASVDRVVRVGNLDVRRDFLDVRDAVVAYRLLLELTDDRAVGQVVNVSSGRSIAIRTLLGRMAERAGIAPHVVTDPDLVRVGEAMDSRGDCSRLNELTGWSPAIALEEMIDEVMDEAMSRQAAAPRPWPDPS